MARFVRFIAVAVLWLAAAWLAAPLFIGVACAAGVWSGTGPASVLLDAYDARNWVQVMDYRWPNMTGRHCRIPDQELGIEVGGDRALGPEDGDGKWNPSGGIEWVGLASLGAHFRSIRSDRVRALSKDLTKLQQGMLITCILGSPFERTCSARVRRALEKNQVPTSSHLLDRSNISRSILEREKRRDAWDEKTECVYAAGLRKLRAAQSSEVSSQ